MELNKITQGATMKKCYNKFNVVTCSNYKGTIELDYITSDVLWNAFCDAKTGSKTADTLEKVHTLICCLMNGEVTPVDDVDDKELAK